VRALKTLYTPNSSSSGTGAGTPTSPITTTTSIDGAGVFSVEAFALRVQALISDDRALMERLIRFAQAHDLLKKNAERAQKLAQDSNVALETYQRQVRTLEEHIARGDGRYVAQLPFPGSEALIERVGREKSSSFRRRRSRSNSARQSRQRRCGS
jgi:anthranilate/para-aminobenzoate synthase component I